MANSRTSTGGGVKGEKKDEEGSYLACDVNIAWLPAQWACQAFKPTSCHECSPEFLDIPIEIINCSFHGMEAAFFCSHVSAHHLTLTGSFIPVLTVDPIIFLDGVFREC